MPQVVRFLVTIFRMSMNFMEGIEAQLAVSRSSNTEGVGSVYSKVARWAAMIGLSLSLLFFLPFTSSVIELNKQLLLVLCAGVALVSWLVHIVVSGNFYWRPSIIGWGVLALWASTLLATLFSNNWFISLFGFSNSLSNSLVTISSLAVLFFVGSAVLDDKGTRLQWLLNWSLILSLLIGFIQMVGLFWLPFAFAKTEAFNTIGSLNTLGILAALSLAILYRGFSSDRVSLYANKVGIALALAILVILNWWVLWTIAIIAMAAVIALDNFSNRNEFKLSRFIFPMAVIVVGVFLMIISFNIPVLRQNYPVEVAPSIGLSSDVAGESLKKSFILGSGPETFHTAFNMYGASTLANSNLSNLVLFDGSGEIITWTSSVGTLGGLAMLFLVLMSLYSIWKAMARGLTDERYIGPLAALAALSVALFLYPFGISLYIIWFALLTLTTIFVSNRFVSTPIEGRPALSLIASLGFIVGLILSLVGIYFMATVYAADTAYTKALASQEVMPAVENLNSAISWNANDSRYFRASSQAALILIRDEISNQENSEGKQDRVQNYVSSAIQLAQQATNVDPMLPENWSNLGNTYRSLIGFVDGVDALAEGAFNKAAELRPGDPAFFNSIGDTYLAKADFMNQVAAQGGAAAQKAREDAATALMKAEGAYKKAIELSGQYGLAIYSLGGVYDRQGKITEAIKQLETIIPFNANQPNLAFELGLLYYRDNQKDKALAQLQRAVTLSPDFANARWYTALIFEERNDLPKAIEQLEKILTTEANKDNQAVITKLEALRAGNVTNQEVIEQQPIE